MPKVEDFNKYFTELAKAAGIPEDQVEKTLEVLGNEKVRNGLIPLPNYSHDLDAAKVKGRDEAKEAAITETKAFYDKWWRETGEPAYNKSLAVVEEWGKYKETYGALDDSSHSNAGNGNGNSGKMLTMDEVEKLLSDRLAAYDASVVSKQKAAMSAATRYLHEFGEPLDPDAFDQFAQQGGYTNVNQAFDAFVRPKREEKTNADWEAKLKKEREAGVQEGMTRAMNGGTLEREPGNMFLRQKEENSDPNAGKKSFMSAWQKQANQ